MNYLDLFSGIGGFAYGAYLAGMKFDHHYFSEVEPYAVELYQKRFPEATALGDITKSNEWELPDGEWIITGGFPCQDISIAGEGKGITGSRSGLWFEMHRIISRVRPRFVIAENVGALTFRGLDAVLGSLAEIGYDAEWQDIRAEDVGAPHRRERIWIVAYPNGMRCGAGSDRNSTGAADSEGKHGSEIEQERRGQRVGSGPTGETSDPSSDRLEVRRMASGGSTGQSNGSGKVRKVADPSSRNARKSETRNRGEGACGRSEESRKEFPDTSGIRCDQGGAVGGAVSEEAGGTEPCLRSEAPEEELAYTDPEGLQRYSGANGSGAEGRFKTRSQGIQRRRADWWAVEPDVGRLAYGISSRVDRLKGLGNAIVPQIAEVLFRLIKEIKE
jgi:DNA (cytosine-5)-methyltransferase 1